MKRTAGILDVKRTCLFGVLLLFIALISCTPAGFYDVLGDDIAYIPVKIAPAAATLFLGSNLTFSATGGVPPYRYSVVSGFGSVNSASGVFSASSVGTVIIRVRDKNKKTSDATVNVVTTTGLDVDYAASAPTHTGPLVAGGGLSESFTLENSGTDGGGLGVYWTAYVSTDSSATIDGGAVVIDSGTNGPLGASPASTVIGFTGTWPSAPGTYYLKVQLSTADDINTANNVQVSTAYVTTALDVDYAASAPTHTGPLVAGASLSESFTLRNLGTAAGAQSVRWTVYVSADSSPTIDAGATVIDSDTHGSLGASPDSAIVGFTGTWPIAFGSYYLKVQLSATDDNDSTNDIKVSAVYATTPPTVNYVVSSVTDPGGSALPAGTIDGSFQLSNSGPNKGSQPVIWSAYISLTTAVDASAILIDSGVSQPLENGESIEVSFSGRWPLHYGSYHLVVSASAPPDVEAVPGNNVAATGVTSVGLINEPGEPPYVNNDVGNLDDTTNLGVTLLPGMSVQVKGFMTNTSDAADVYGLETGTATSVTVYVSWTDTSHNVSLKFMSKSPVTVLQQASTALMSLSLSWFVIPTGIPLWIDVENPLAQTIPEYTLIITGN
jgi:hypothetical protein